MLYNEPARGMDMVTLGLLGDSAHAQDVHITGELTEHLFTNDPPHGPGPDLAAIDITRGREHGVPGQTSSIIIIIITIIIIVVVVVIVTVIEHYSVRQRDAFSAVS